MTDTNTLSGRKVWVVHISHRHGSGAEVFSTKANANAYLGRWARNWWHEVAHNGDECPADDDEAIAVYFDRAQDEQCDMEEIEIDRAASVAAAEATDA